MDASCIPEGIRYPHDVTLLDEARQKTEKAIDMMHEKAVPSGKKPRTYRKRARKEFLRFIKNKKRNTRDFRRALKKQTQYVSRNLRIIKEMAEETGLRMLSREQYRDLLVISGVARQQTEMPGNSTRSIPGKLMSIRKPHVRPIARGKARAMYEYGAKISVSLACVPKGFTEVVTIWISASNIAYGYPVRNWGYLRRCRKEKGNFPQRARR
ncbi:MAG: hypothetical protein WC405_20745 [Syntrophales bacterium]